MSILPLPDATCGMSFRRDSDSNKDGDGVCFSYGMYTSYTPIGFTLSSSGYLIRD